MKDTIYRFPLRASTPRNSASSPRFVSVHLITAIPPPLVPSPFFPEVWRIQEAGGQRREERRRREGSNEWRRRKERMSCLPLEKHDRPIRMDKKALSLPFPSFTSRVFPRRPVPRRSEREREGRMLRCSVCVRNFPPKIFLPKKD